MTLTLVPPGRRAVEVSVRAECGSTLREVAAALAMAVGGTDVRGGDVAGTEMGGTEVGGGFWSGSARLSLETPLGSPGLRHGSVLGLGGPGPRGPAPPSVLELRVVGGPWSGRTIGLGRGEHLIGRDAACDVVLPDPLLSRRHVRVRVAADGVSVADAGATNPAEVDETPVRGTSIPLGPDALLRLGESLVSVAAPRELPGRPEPAPDGTLHVQAAPRLRGVPTATTVELPTRPTPRSAARLAVIALMVPLAAGGLLALLLRTPAFLLFTLLSPLMLLGTWLSDRSGRRRGTRSDRLRYEAELREARARRDAAVRRDTTDLRLRAPDPGAIVQTALRHGRRLWERRPGDPDWAQLRLGTARLPGGVSMREGAVTTPVHVEDLPVLVDLGSVGVLGLRGPPGPLLGLARLLVCQLAVAHGPRFLAIVPVMPAVELPGWAWGRWLPQWRTVDADPAVTLNRLLGLTEDRIGAVSARANPSLRAPPDTVVLICGDPTSAADPVLARILREGPAVGVVTIWLSGPAGALPGACEATGVIGGAFGSRLQLRMRGQDPVRGVLVDGLDADLAEAVARSLAPLHEPGGGPDVHLPTTLRLFALPGLPGPGATDLAARWAVYDGVPMVPIGVSVRGVFRVDLVRDGPHALVAGTTGAGKSELLQTLLAGLVAIAPPTALQLVLVDYKGGAAFRELARLPHTAGLVTDLDEHLTRRALTSLRAELTRRERVLGAAGATDLAGYLAGGGAMARLVIVVDEFAALVQELPDFVEGLVAVAARGRSLGIHLVLATQRPGGSVTPAIRANTGLRIALRVTDDGESRDIVEQAGAARISRHTPGRALFRAGAEPATLVQTARVSVRPVARGPRPPRVGRGWADPDTVDTEPSDEDTPTDLQRLVDAACAADAAGGWPAPPIPWLPALPDLICVSDLRVSDLRVSDPRVSDPRVSDPRVSDVRAADLRTADAGRSVVLGLVDRPDEQRRELLTYDLATESSLLIAGGPGSGRSTTLRTLLYGLARAYDADDLHVHLIDTASGLDGARGLPHCGTVLGRDDVDRGRRLLARLVGSLQERQRAPSVPVPYVLLVVDGWEAVTQVYEPVDAGAPVEALLRLVREGGPVGIRVVLTSDRAGLGARLSGAVARRLVLPLSDRGDYALAGVPARAVPGHRPPGRALLAGSGLECQIAVCAPDGSAAAQDTALATVAGQTTPARTRPALRISALPRTFPRERLPPPTGPMRVPLGVGGDEGGPVVLDLDALGPGLLVAGPARSGRTSTLLTLAAGLVEGGTRVIAVCGRRSPLRDVVPAYRAADDLGAAIDDLDAHPGVVLVDDLETLLDTAAEVALLAHLREEGPGCVIGAGRTEDLTAAFRGLGAQLRRRRTGLLLTPSALDGELLGVRLPRGVPDRTPGRGQLVVAGTTTRVQVALPGPAGRPSAPDPPALSPGAGTPPGSAGRRSP